MENVYVLQIPYKIIPITYFPIQFMDYAFCSVPESAAAVLNIFEVATYSCE